MEICLLSLSYGIAVCCASFVRTSAGYGDWQYNSMFPSAMELLSAFVLCIQSMLGSVNGFVKRDRKGFSFETISLARICHQAAGLYIDELENSSARVAILAGVPNSSTRAREDWSVLV